MASVDAEGIASELSVLLAGGRLALGGSAVSNCQYLWIKIF